MSAITALPEMLNYELDDLAQAHATLMNIENPDFDNEDDSGNTWSAWEARQHLIEMLKSEPFKLASLLPRLMAFTALCSTASDGQNPTLH